MPQVTRVTHPRVWHDSSPTESRLMNSLSQFILWNSCVATWWNALMNGVASRYHDIDGDVASWHALMNGVASHMMKRTHEWRRVAHDETHSWMASRCTWWNALMNGVAMAISRYRDATPFMRAFHDAMAILQYHDIAIATPFTLMNSLSQCMTAMAISPFMRRDMMKRTHEWRRVAISRWRYRHSWVATSLSQFILSNSWVATHEFERINCEREFMSRDSVSTWQKSHSWILSRSAWESTDRGDRTWNHYDWQNTQQVFTGVPIQIKHVFTGVPQISNEFSRE